LSASRFCHILVEGFLRRVCCPVLSSMRRPNRPYRTGRRTSRSGWNISLSPLTRKWRNGRRTSLRGWRGQPRGGSNPPFRTKPINNLQTPQDHCRDFRLVLCRDFCRDSVFPSSAVTGISIRSSRLASPVSTRNSEGVFRHLMNAPTAHQIAMTRAFARSCCSRDFERHRTSREIGPHSKGRNTALGGKWDRARREIDRTSRETNRG
jgi:hypothetical protein